MAQDSIRQQREGAGCGVGAGAASGRKPGPGVQELSEMRPQPPPGAFQLLIGLKRQNGLWLGPNVRLLFLKTKNTRF